MTLKIIDKEEGEVCDEFANLHELVKAYNNGELEYYTDSDYYYIKDEDEVE